MLEHEFEVLYCLLFDYYFLQVIDLIMKLSLYALVFVPRCINLFGWSCLVDLVFGRT